MIAVKKQIGILQKNIFLLQRVVKNPFENQVVVVTACSSFVLAVCCNGGDYNVDYKNNSVI